MYPGYVAKLLSCWDICMRIWTESTEVSRCRSLYASTMNAVKMAEKRPAYVTLHEGIQNAIQREITHEYKKSINILIIRHRLIIIEFLEHGQELSPTFGSIHFELGEVLFVHLAHFLKLWHLYFILGDLRM